MPSITVPRGFIWGAATSSYQVEGAWDEDGKGESIWDRFSHTPGNILDASNGDVAADQYHRYREDAALLRDLQLGGYRFSISWPRIFPDGTGALNRAGLDYYDRLVDALLEVGVTPFPTLYHWDLPQALQERGGWADRSIIPAFSRYAETVVRALSDRVATWTVLNEPYIFVFDGLGVGRHAPGIRDEGLALRASHVVNLAHADAIRAIRAVRGDLAIGSAYNTDPAYPASDDPADVAAAERFHALNNAWFLEPILKGRYPVAFLDQEAVLGRMDIRPGDMESHEDDVRLPRRQQLLAWADRLRPGRAPSAASAASPGPDPGRRSTGRSIRRRSTTSSGAIDREYGPLPIYITENGCSYPTGPGSDGQVHDAERIAYYEAHIGQVARAISEGSDIRGYFAWSLLDNFEWAWATHSVSGSSGATSPTGNGGSSRTAATGSAT